VHYIPAMRSHVIAMVATNLMPIFEFAVACEVFGTDRSDVATPWYELRVCAAQDGPLYTATGLQVHPRHGLGELIMADTVLIPACCRAVQLAAPTTLVEALRAAHANGARIVSISSGSYLPAAAGLLDGRRATAHWMNAADLANRYPAILLDPTVLYVNDGGLITSAGTGSAIDVCLHLIRIDHGAAAANEVARRLVLPPHRDGGHAQFARPAARLTRPGNLNMVLDWARQRLDQPLTVAALAREAHQSPRTFARHFRQILGTSPLQWLIEQRVRLAQELLETTDAPIEQIARSTGFGNAANLRQHFGRINSVSPQAYRHVFRHRSGRAIIAGRRATNSAIEAGTPQALPNAVAQG
jgi:transcriptional regulator GlxA family with amidase domain